MGAFIALLVTGTGIAAGLLLVWRPHARLAIVAVILGMLLAFLPAARRPVAAARQHRSASPQIFGAGPRLTRQASPVSRSAVARPRYAVAAPVDPRAEPGIVLRRADASPARMLPAPVDPRTEPAISLRRPGNSPARVLADTRLRDVARRATGIAVRDGQGLIIGTVKVPEGNVRSGPGTDNRIIGTVNQGDQLIFVGRSGTWYLVRLGDSVSARSRIAGEQGWVSSILINKLDQEPPLVASAVRSPHWLAASDPEYIYQRDGVLHFQVTEEQAGQPISARLDAPADAAPLKEFSFMATLAWSQGHAPGGVILHALLGDGRDLSMRIGPGEGFPWVDFTLDGQELTSRGRGFPLYTATPIRLAWNGRHVVLSVADEPRIELPVDSPIQSIRFAVETEEGCIFHLKIAEMRVKYAE